jgi:magnesium transporter
VARERRIAQFLGALVFWGVLLFFLATAANALGLALLSSFIESLSLFVPRVFTAVLILVMGLLLGNFARGAVTATASGAGTAIGPGLGQAVRVAIIIAAMLIAVTELGVDIGLLTALFSVAVAALLGGFALAFGLGARTAVGNIIGSHYVRQTFEVGQTARISGIEGRIVELTATTVVLEVPEGRAIVPAGQFGEMPSTLLVKRERAVTAVEHLAQVFLETRPARAAVTLGRMPAENTAAVLRAVPPAVAGSVLPELTVAYAAECLGHLDLAEAAALLAVLATGDATALMRALEPERREPLLALLPAPVRDPITRLLPYVEGTAGAVMDPSVFQLPEEILVADARVRVGRAAGKLLYYLYVVDRKRHLVGVLDVAELMFARPRHPVAAVMHRDVDRIGVGMPVALVRAHAGWQRYHAMPVVDDDDRLVGAIRYQTLRRLEREASERGPNPGRVTAGALAELFQLGTAGLVTGIAATGSVGSGVTDQSWTLGRERPMGNDMLVGFEELARTYARELPLEAAQCLEELPVEEIVPLLSTAPVRLAVPLLEHLAPHLAAELLVAMPPAGRRDLVTAMDPVAAVSLLAWMEDEPRSVLLDLLDPSLARELRAMAEYPPQTAGRIMDPRAVGIRAGATVGEALGRLRAGRNRVADVFLIDDDRRLTGIVPIELLAVAPPAAPVESLARPAVMARAIDPQEDVVEHFNRERLASLPVVDIDGRLLGVIRYDTLAQTAQESAAADMLTMVGASPQERALSPVAFTVRKRLPWLEINLATGFLAASVVGIFEGTIARFTALAVLLPVVAGQAGNTGAQALAVTMRGLAMREIRISHWPRVVRKEASVALINGFAVSATTAAGVFFWSRSPGLALVIGISMILSMVAAGVAGVLVPTVLTKFGQDPAQSSSIILTTVTDVAGFGSFLGIATLLSALL